MNQLSSHKHEKVKRYIPLAEGGVKIVSESYYEELSGMVEEIEKPVLTSFNTLKHDVELAVDKHFIQDKTTKLVITLELKNGEPRLKKKWTTLKKNYKHR